jgi:hypothetical protein
VPCHHNSGYQNNIALAFTPCRSAPNADSENHLIFDSSFLIWHFSNKTTHIKLILNKHDGGVYFKIEELILSLAIQDATWYCPPLPVLSGAYFDFVYRSNL